MNPNTTPFQNQNQLPIETGRTPTSTPLPADESRSQERWLAAGRTVWLIVTPVVVALNILAIRIGFIRLQTVCQQARCDFQLNPTQAQQLQNLGLSLAFFAFLLTSFFALAAAVFVIVALILFKRQSGGWIGLLGAFTLVVFGTITAFESSSLISITYPWLRLPVMVLDYSGNILLPLLIIIFPDGRLKPRWTILLVAAWAVWRFPSYLFPNSPLDSNTWPLGIQMFFWVGFIGSLIGVQYYRYRRQYGPVLRQQTKWVVYGLMVSLGGFVTVRSIFALMPVQIFDNVLLVIFDTVVVYLLISLIPVSFAIAILRYKLWDVDLLINRTLVYIPLTAILGGLFSASITLFQKIFIATTGEKSDAALVMTTFVLVSTFTPIRNGLQMAVDKRFKETKDPLKEINALDDQVRSVVEVLDAHTITRRLLETSVSAFRAFGGAVYLEQAGKMELTYATPDWRKEDGEISFPLEWNGRKLGALCLGARETGLEYNAQERQVLQQAAERVARVIAGFN